MSKTTQRNMKAIRITGYGGPEVLKAVEMEMPAPCEGEVLIKVHTAGINRPDIMQRQGHYPPPEGASPVPGLEVAGEIAEIPRGTKTAFSVGDKVVALLNGGGYATYCTAPAGQCLPLPKNLDMIQAAALPECTFTVWRNLMQLGALAPGEVALIHGGASGIGTTAIQIARCFGATVLTTAGTDTKCRACKEIGANLSINYQTQDFVTQTLDFTKGEGVDVILDIVGGTYIEKNISLLRYGGRHISIAFLNGARATIKIPDIMKNRLTVTGSTLRPRPIVEKAALAQNVLDTLWPKIEQGSVKPVIYDVLPLNDVQQAHEILERGDHIGKLVLQMPKV